MTGVVVLDVSGVIAIGAMSVADVVRFGVTVLRWSQECSSCTFNAMCWCRKIRRDGNLLLYIMMSVQAAGEVTTLLSRKEISTQEQDLSTE